MASACRLLLRLPHCAAPVHCARPRQGLVTASWSVCTRLPTPLRFVHLSPRWPCSLHCTPCLAPPDGGPTLAAERLPRPGARGAADHPAWGGQRQVGAQARARGAAQLFNLKAAGAAWYRKLWPTRLELERSRPGQIWFPEHCPAGVLRGASAAACLSSRPLRRPLGATQTCMRASSPPHTKCIKFPSSQPPPPLLPPKKAERRPSGPTCRRPPPPATTWPPAPPSTPRRCPSRTAPTTREPLALLEPFLGLTGVP